MNDLSSKKNDEQLLLDKSIVNESIYYQLIKRSFNCKKNLHANLLLFFQKEQKSLYQNDSLF